MLMVTPLFFFTYSFEELAASRFRLFVESERIPREEGVEVDAGEGVRII